MHRLLKQQARATGVAKGNIAFMLAGLAPFVSFCIHLVSGLRNYNNRRLAHHLGTNATVGIVALPQTMTFTIVMSGLMLFTMVHPWPGAKPGMRIH